MVSPSKRIKNSISEELLKSINCCLWEKTTGIKHYANQAILLPCGGNACKKCILYSSDKSKLVDCKFCDKIHLKSAIIMNTNPVIEHIINSFIDDLKEKLLTELNNQIETCTDEKIDQEIDIRFNDVEYQLDIRIESIIAELHEYREDFKKEMDESKEKYKQSQKSNDYILRMRVNSNDIMKLTAETEMNYQNFMITHKKINISKLQLKSLMDEMNEIKLNSSLKIDYKELIGELRIPLWKRINHSWDIKFPYARDLCCFTYSIALNSLIMCDSHGFFIKYDFKLKRGLKFPHPEIEDPYLLCMAGYDELVVCDGMNNTKKIVIFDLRQLTVIGKFTISIDTVPNNISYDMYARRRLLYLACADKNEVKVLNFDDGQEVCRFEIDSPDRIVFSHKYIYVLSSADYIENQQTGVLDRITRGSNCIFKLNKNYEMIDKICFDNWLQPRGLSIQGDLILTVAYELDRNKVISNNRYLHVIKGREILTKIKLIDNKCDFNDIVFYENKVTILYGTSIKIIEFVK